MAGTDLIDERGHTEDDAEAQEPLYDAEAPAASEESPANADGSPSGDVIVRAQTVEEVTAQVENPVGEDEPSES